MTTHVTSAVQAAAKEIIGVGGYVCDLSPQWIEEVILRHVEPIVGAVELSAREMEGAARSYRDRMNSALARAEQSEALLRDVREYAEASRSDAEERSILADDDEGYSRNREVAGAFRSIVERIDAAHLTPKDNP